MNLFNKNKTKLVIHSAPKTGARFLKNEIESSLNLKDNEVFAIHDSSREFESKFKKITILRDPKDSIVSICTSIRFFGNFLLKTEIDAKDVVGKSVWQIKMANPKTHFELYKNFYKNVNKNFDSLTVIDFNKLVNNTDDVIKNISEIYNIPYRNKKITYEMFNDFDNGFLLSSKITSHYEIVKNDINKFEKELSEIYKEYNECLEKLIDYKN